MTEQREDVTTPPGSEDELRRLRGELAAARAETEVQGRLLRDLCWMPLSASTTLEAAIGHLLSALTGDCAGRVALIRPDQPLLAHGAETGEAPADFALSFPVPQGATWTLCAWARAGRELGQRERATLETATRLAAAAAQIDLLRHRAGEAEAARDQALSMISHELRSPLQTLGVGVELLLLKLQSPGEQPATEWLRDRVERNLLAVRRLGQLVDTLLSMARLRVGNVDLQPEMLDLAEVAREALQHAEEDAKWAGSACTVVASGDTSGRWDRRLLSTIAGNLLSNALKYGAGNPVSVTAEGFAGHATLSVRDLGPGIAKVDQQQLFQPFLRLPNRSTVSGLGLGLWIVRQLAHSMGGEIELQSAPGLGSTFTLRLPR